MQLDITRIDSLPRLAWCLEVAGGEAHAWVGPWVEVGAGWFIEGAWNGDFAAGDFVPATCQVGSGVRQDGDDLIVSTPTSTLDDTYSYRAGDALVVSNSLTFLMERTGLEPDPAYPDYFFDLIDAHRRGIRTKPHVIHGGIEVHNYINMRLSSDGSLTYESKNRPERPDDFASMRLTMSTTMHAVFDNASDERRSHRYRPVATLSRGYDSAAVAALAADLGCTEAVTSADPDKPYDNGRPVGEALGMTVTEYPRELPADMPTEAIAEFLAVPAGVDVPKSLMADQLEGSILLIGNHGDFVFSKSRGFYPDYGHPGAYAGGGASTAEFRKRIGMLSFPVPSIMALYPEETYQIANTPEMEPWTIGGDYDRPVARRLAEEAGVPREMFGQTKAATGHIWPHRSQLPQATTESIRSFVRTTSFRPGRGRSLGSRLIKLIQSEWGKRSSGLFRRQPPKIKALVRPIVLASLWRRPHGLYASPFLYSFHWGVAQIRERYRF